MQIQPLQGWADRNGNCQINLFGRSTITMDEVKESPEVVWLGHYGKKIDAEALAVEELVKSEEIFTVFFSKHTGEDLTATT